MTIFLRLLLIAALVWFLLRLLRQLVLGPPAGARRGADRSEHAEPRSTDSSETLVSCEVCGLRVPEGESRSVRLPDGDHRVCSEECRRRLAS